MSKKRENSFLSAVFHTERNLVPVNSRDITFLMCTQSTSASVKYVFFELEKAKESVKRGKFYRSLTIVECIRIIKNLSLKKLRLKSNMSKTRESVFFYQEAEKCKLFSHHEVPLDDLVLLYYSVNNS